MSDEDSYSSLEVTLLPNMDFDHEAARARLCAWPLPCFEEGLSGTGRHLKISHIVDSDAVNMVSKLMRNDVKACVSNFV